MPIRISYPQDTIRMPLSAFTWQPEIAEPGHRVVGKLIGDRRSLQVMPDTIEVVSEQTGHVVTFKQRYADIHRYYSTESDYLIEIFF